MKKEKRVFAHSPDYSSELPQGNTRVELQNSPNVAEKKVSLNVDGKLVWTGIVENALALWLRDNWARDF